MDFVVFGLTASSTWGNGHATLWRGLARALGEAGHGLLFLERDQRWYAGHRDLTELPGGRLRIYGELGAVRPEALAAVDAADVVVVTSYCPDALAATELCLASRARLKVFYDRDRVLAEHTAEVRARQLVAFCEAAAGAGTLGRGAAGRPGAGERVGPAGREAPAGEAP